MTAKEMTDRIMDRYWQAGSAVRADMLPHILLEELAPAFEAHRLELDALKRRMAAAANLLTEQPNLQE